ncbi:MAG: NADH-quinone oxidoreductase subunit L [Deltaproteobacteria bacterium]|nr:NADH-quinone oxidoreductase subunit L [Deltaproteobacteria bacterium]
MNLIYFILLPLLGAILNGSIALISAGRKKEEPRALVSAIALGVMLVAFALAIPLALDFFSGRTDPILSSLFSWITVGNFKVDFALSLDRLSVVLLLIITGVGSLIHLYSVGYMKGEAGYAKYFAYLNLFVASMLVLVLGENLLMMFLGWEGVGLCSYLLIGFWFEDEAKAKAGKKAFIVNRVGDFGFLLGIFLLISFFLPEAKEGVSILSFSYLKTYIHELGHAHVIFIPAGIIGLCFFIGAMGKSAQIPLYVWLPDAMAGPTPVSALIHAATMVTAGVYMIARMHFLYDLAPWVLQFIGAIGAITALFAASIGLVQRDIKKVLAYSTVSQLGFMFLAMGVGAYATGVFHLMTHAFFKACLFLGSGSVIHAMGGEQDIRRMGGLRKSMPITFWTFLIATLAIAGFPPLSAFFSKDEILWEAFHRGHSLLAGLGFLAALMTSFYMFRLTFLTFFGDFRGTEEQKHHLHESPWTMTLPLIVLAILSTVGGWVGIPHLLGGHAQFQNFLGLGHGSLEVTASDHLWELSLMVLSVGLALLGMLLAYVFYIKNQSYAECLARRFPRLYRLLLNKYYVDEIYDALIVNPIKGISETFFSKTVDQKFINQVLVEGSAKTVKNLGRVLNWLQSGQVSVYAFYFLAVISVAVFYLVFS